MVPGPTETVCPQEMTPEVPAGSQKVEGEQPGEFVQMINVGPDVFVEDVPKDDEQPDTKVYKSVEPDVSLGSICFLIGSYSCLHA